VAYWLAYKSKELAVMLPAILAIYEYWVSETAGFRFSDPNFCWPP